MTLHILAITTPIFLLMGAGYIAVLTSVISTSQIQGIGTFVIYCALPALIISALAQRPLSEIFNQGYLLAYGLASLVIFLAALFIAYRLQHKPLNGSALYALGMSASNSGFIGYPVAALVIGPPAVIALALNMLVENLLIIPLALALAEVSMQRGGSFAVVLGHTMIRLAKNPILIAIVVGAGISLSGLGLPGPVLRSIDMLAAASAPTALFVIGGTLCGLKVSSVASDITQIALGKLVVHPTAVLLAFLVLPTVDPVLMTAAMIFASAPMISVYPIFGQRYGVGDVTAAALMVATLTSFITISVTIWLMSGSQLFVIQ